MKIIPVYNRGSPKTIPICHISGIIFQPLQKNKMIAPKLANQTTSRLKPNFAASKISGNRMLVYPKNPIHDLISGTLPIPITISKNRNRPHLNKRGMAQITPVPAIGPSINILPEGNPRSTAKRPRSLRQYSQTPRLCSGRGSKYNLRTITIQKCEQDSPVIPPIILILIGPAILVAALHIDDIQPSIQLVNTVLFQPHVLNQPLSKIHFNLSNDPEI
jgi:hypothetical protein